MLMSLYGFSRGYDNLILLVILVLYRLLVLRSTGKSKYQCTHFPSKKNVPWQAMVLVGTR